jgi:two-component system, chemotaxis family, chemotaxis protein CheY
MVAGRRLPEDRQAVAPCRVYICDDSPEYRLLLRMVLADEGAIIVGEGADGGECLEGAAATDPSLVLLDLNMPGVGGLEALPKLREALPDVKIVVLTTSKATESQEAAMAAGADAYVSKPIDATSVPRLLREGLAA